MKRKDKNSNYNRIIRDEAIENAASFEEARAIIVSRLNSLRADLADRSTAENTIISEICRAQDDKKKSLLDLYAGYFSPCKVTDPTYTPKGEADMNDIMINFSEGFRNFVESLEEEYVDLIVKRRRATILLSRMFSIRMPYSLLLYLFYYKRLEPVKILDAMYISRATFFRIKSSAINAVTQLYYPNDKKQSEQGDSKESA